MVHSKKENTIINSPVKNSSSHSCSFEMSTAWKTLAVKTTSLLIFCLFIIGVSFPTLWYIKPDQKRGRIVLAGNQINWKFQHIPLTEKTVKILGTTNIVNGFYENTNGTIVSFYLATWEAQDHADLNPIAHTPEICWPASGWEQQETASSKKLEVSLLPNQELRFECQVFKSPDQKSKEFAIWTTLLHRETIIKEELVKSNPKNNSIASQDSMLREINWGYFVQRLVNRKSSHGVRQQIRISIKIQTTETEARSILSVVAHELLTVSNN